MKRFSDFAVDEAAGKKIEDLARAYCSMDSPLYDSTFKSSTDPDRFKVPHVWDGDLARKNLGIPWMAEEHRHEEMPSNIQGYTNFHGVFVRDHARRPIGTLVHEMGHWLLNHNNLLGLGEIPFIEDYVEGQADIVSYLVTNELGLEIDSSCAIVAVIKRVPTRIAAYPKYHEPAERAAERIYNAGKLAQ